MDPDVNRFHYPVVRVYLTHSELVSEHLTKADAEHAAAYLDFIAEDTGVYHLAGDHRRAN